MSNNFINNIILNYLIQKNNKVNNKKLNYLINNYHNLYSYIISLVYYYNSINEIIYRILYNELKQKYCPICGNPLKYYGKHNWAKHCCTKCSTLDKETQNKLKQTYQLKYGVNCSANLPTNNFKVNNPQKNKKIHERTKQTCLEKYGVEYGWNNENQKKTCLEKYGVENVRKSSIIKQKIKNTKLERYNDENYNNREKSKLTCLEKYGVDNYSKTKEYYTKINWNNRQDKIIKTKIKHNSFNTSNPEEYSYLLLKEKYPDIKRQYKDDRYPFACDFYIPSLDLFIECNYHWTHGGKLFEGIEDDNIKLNKWKNKNTKFYNNAIYTWTDLDVRKYNMAKENNLNYLIFYNINELKEWLKNKGDA